MNPAELVKQFTEESKNIKVPNTPELMTKPEVEFAIEMVFSEMVEIALTVTDNKYQAYMLCMEMLVKATEKHKKGKEYVKPSGDKLIAEQMDGFVDAMYYMYNAACKKGCNLDKLFMCVHNANMSKKIDGKFLQDENGKIIKPPGYKEADIEAEIIKQKNNAWN